MKRKIILSLICCLIVIGLATGCGKSENYKLAEKVKNSFDNLYNIEILDIVYEKNSNNVIRKMKADDMEFYIYNYSEGTGLSPTNYIYTSILSSVYEKYKTEIQNIGKKYNLNVSYNFSTDMYEKKEYFNDCEICKGHFITVNDNSNEEMLNLFVKDVLNIEEINRLYQLWQDGNIYVYDYSDLVIDNNSSISLFEYYKLNK